LGDASQEGEKKESGGTEEGAPSESSIANPKGEPGQMKGEQKGQQKRDN